MPHGIKQTNEYAKTISPALYELMPKTVLAAIAVSYYINTGRTDIDAALLEEWRLLNLNGIVPQKPPAAK